MRFNLTMKTNILKSQKTYWNFSVIFDRPILLSTRIDKSVLAFITSVTHSSLYEAREVRTTCKYSTNKWILRPFSVCSRKLIKNVNNFNNILVILIPNSLNKDYKILNRS